jgi:hypothetical protein
VSSEASNMLVGRLVVLGFSLVNSSYDFITTSHSRQRSARSRHADWGSVLYLRARQKPNGRSGARLQVTETVPIGSMDSAL